MKLVWLLAIALPASAACGRREEPRREMGMPDAPQPSRAQPTTPAPRRQVSQPSAYDYDRPSSYDTTASTQPVPQGGAVAPRGALPDTAAPRDLSSELSSALAGTSECVDLAQAAKQPGGKQTISVSAVVLGTGTISRASVQANGQPAAALTCIERAVLAMKLGAPVPDAPVTVRATTEVQVRAAPPAAPTTAPPAPARLNPDIARPEPGDMARPDQADLAGPP
jgi:hypothetical protein